MVLNRHLSMSSLLLLALTATASGAVSSIHVSPRGSDGSMGTIESPVATPSRAQELARQAMAQGSAVEVVLHGGTYYLAQPLVFSQADSGTQAAPALWRAAEGETPVFSGAQHLTHLQWKAISPGSPIFQAKVPEGTLMDQLWVNEVPVWMARFPNRENGPGLNVFDTWPLDHSMRSDPSRDALAPERIKRWSDPTGAFLHAMHPALWGGIHFRITGVKPDGRLAMEGGTQNNRGSGLHSAYRFIENVREELDAPGEWFFDRKTLTLELYPPAGVDLNTAELYAARLPNLVEFRGTREQPVRSVRLSGITFRHTTRTFMETREPLLRTDWTIYRGGAILAIGTEDCQILDSTLRDLGGNAVFVSNYNRRLVLRGAHITETGGNGICFVGSADAVRNPLFSYGAKTPYDKLDRTPGPKSEDYPADCLVEDSLITRTGRVEKQTAGVEIDMAQAITVRHCSIYDMPRSGINIGDGCWGGHIIEFCDIFNTVLETGDHGSFNSWGRDRYWPGGADLEQDERWKLNEAVPLLDVVRPIVLRNNRWRCDHGWDIDLDDGSSNYQIYNNLCLNGGIKNREGFSRVVENNVIVNNGFHPHVWYRHSGDIFRRNIVGIDGYRPARMSDKEPWGAQLDFNLVHEPGLQTPKPAARMAGQSRRDEHSILVDAGFIDPAGGDYRVTSHSPALALGFVNFDMSPFGVVKASLRAIAKTPVLPSGMENRGSAKTLESVHWCGAKLRTLTTLEEASSFGVGLTRGGAIVIEVAAGSPAARAGIKSGDLIVGIGGKRIIRTGDLADLKAAAVTVVRDQVDLQLP